MSICLHVEPIIGGSILEVCAAMILLARKLDIMVTAEINEIPVVVSKSDRAMDVESAYFRQLRYRAANSVTAAFTAKAVTDSGLDLVAHLHRAREFSERTFGPGRRTEGIVDHIRKELLEVLAKPDDISEWIDVAILAFDGAWRAGHTPEQIAAALVAKQTKNESRQWPDWRTAEPGKAIEHVRDGLRAHPGMNPTGQGEEKQGGAQGQPQILQASGPQGNENPTSAQTSAPGGDL